MDISSTNPIVPLTGTKVMPPLSAASLWGDDRFVDAYIIMGDQTWKVHRWVLCLQSEYFMKSLEGHFKEASDTIVDLTSSPHSSEDISALLEFLYTKNYSGHYKKDPLVAFSVAEYFKVDELRYSSYACLTAYLRHLLRNRAWLQYLDLARRILDKKWEGRLPQDALVILTSRNYSSILHDGNIWEQMTEASPGFADRVLQACFPKPTPPEPASESTNQNPLKRTASGASDDTVRRPKGKGGVVKGKGRSKE